MWPTWVVLLVSLYSPWTIQKDSHEKSFVDLFLHLWGKHGNDWKSTVGSFAICEAVPFWNLLIGELWEHKPSELLIWNAIIFTILENKLFKLKNFRATDDMKPWNICVILVNTEYHWLRDGHHAPFHLFRPVWWDRDVNWRAEKHF